MNSDSPRQCIFIMVDTQRKDMLGCYGNPDMKTPNLDKMAEEGTRFENAFTCQPVCGPARSALFTGQFPHSNGSWGNSIPLGDNVKTIGQRLQDNEINTAYIGKWHLDGGDYFGLGKCPGGWDPEYWYDMRNYLEELTPEERRESRSIWKYLDPDLNEDFTFGHRCSNKALDYIKKNQNNDFFLVVSYDEPHGPFVCPEPFSTMYQNYQFPIKENVYDDLKNKPEHQRVWANYKTHSKGDKLLISNPAFFGCNSFVDYEIGRVLNSIKEKCPDALVIYTADHGDHLLSHGLNNKGPSMYNEITNIPFIVKYPPFNSGKNVSNELVSHINITPTILEFFSIPISKVIEGKSMLELCKNPKAEINKHIFIEFGRYEIDHDGFGGFQPIRCVFDGEFKLSINLLTTDELYDLKNDPEELINLIENPDYFEVRDKLHDELLNWMNETRDPFRGYYWEIRPWRKDAQKPTWGYTGYTRQREEDERYEKKQLDYNTGLEIKEASRKK